MPKQSPGPWAWEDADNLGGTNYAMCGWLSSGEGLPVLPFVPSILGADAAIIAAAPEMLALLREAAARLEGGCEGDVRDRIDAFLARLGTPPADK